jgi:hypothetical protein
LLRNLLDQRVVQTLTASGFALVCRSGTVNDVAKESGSRLKPGYNVWFGLQHVTLTGFRHSGRRESCPKCNPSSKESAPGQQQAESSVEPD